MHYRHTQLGWTVLAVFVGLSVFLTWQLKGTGVPASWLPLGIMVAVGLLFGTLTVDVDRERVQAAFGVGLIRRAVPLADIAAFQPVRNPWIAGWGIRLIRGGTLWNVSGLDAVELALRDGRFFRIGTDEPEALTRAIEQAAGRPPSDTRAGVAGGLPAAAPPTRWLPLVVVAAVLGVAALVILPMRHQMKPPVFTVQAGRLGVDTPFYGRVYEASAITAVELLPSLPRVEARTNGFSAAGILRGHFRVSGLGQGQIFVDTGNPPFILVRLREGYAIVGLHEAAKTLALYDEMARAWPDKVAARPQ